MNKEKNITNKVSNSRRLLFTFSIVFLLILVGQPSAFATTVTLQWGDSSGATGYKVYYKADSSSPPFNEVTSPNITQDQSTGEFNSTVSGLDSTHSYYFAVTAYNSSGESAYSNTVSVPKLLPITISLSSPSDGSVLSGTANVSATASDNASKVEFYAIAMDNTTTLLHATNVSPYSFNWDTTSFSNGTYSFMAKAYNAANVSVESSVSVNVSNITITVPGTPTAVSATAGNAQATVSFTAPASNGGSPITSYTVTSSGGQTAVGSVSPITVTGLTNGTAYSFTVKATNAIGTGAASAPSNSVTPTAPTTVPDAPTIGTATAGNAQATVAFTPPTSNGGSPITSYTVISSGGHTAVGSASPITVTGLTNGTAYTFTVKATNAIGTSAASAQSNSVTPATVPGAPTISTATAGNAQATVSFSAPASNGGSTITNYTVTSSGGQTAVGSASPITVTGLTNGTAYTFTVKATNAIGTGAASAPSNSVTPTAPATVPGAPTIGTATAGNAQATVSFTAPASNGGSAITSYTVTSSAGQTATGITSPIIVTGLTNGTSYTFTVKATNAIGTSTASAQSNSVTPATVPGAPTIGTATAGNAQATVSFTAPASNGGSPITSYTVTSSGGQTAVGSASPITFTGLTNGTSYTFTVKATNAIGTSPSSASSNSVTPATVPGAPTIGTATAGNTQAIVSFTGPVSNGGSPITSYTVTSSGGQTAVGSASPITVTGLTNGTTYTFTVKATNAIGTSAASAQSNSITPIAPSSPPSIIIISPLSGATYNAKATIVLTAAAVASGNATISTVQFYKGSTLLKTVTTSPYTYTWANVSKGTYTITAKATDSTGASTVSSPVTVNVISNTLGVSFTSISPSSPEPVGTTITFNALASGGLGSYQYQFMVKSPVSGWSTPQAYSTNSSFTWNTTGLPKGTYYVQVMARNVGSSASYEALKCIKFSLR